MSRLPLWHLAVSCISSHHSYRSEWRLFQCIVFPRWMELLAGRLTPSSSFGSHVILQLILKSSRYSSACNDWGNLSPTLHSRRGESTRESGGLVPFTLASRWAKGWRLTSVNLHDSPAFLGVGNYVEKSAEEEARCSPFYYFLKSQGSSSLCWLLLWRGKSCGSLLMSPELHDSFF